MAEPWVELRVHGVSGTPPESMLDIDRVAQAAGDEFGRIFRPADRHGTILPGDGARCTEAYHWGRLTSGSSIQGLWLLLAPFGLVNAAQFTLSRPTTRAQRVLHAVAGGMLRLIGLALTVLFVLAAAVLTMDLWAWQHARATSGVAFVLAMLGPVALLVGYLLLVRSEPALNAAVQPLPTTGSAPEDHPSDLVRPGFFEGAPDAPALRLLHFAAGLAVVAVLGFAPGAARADLFGRAGFLGAAGLLAVVTVAVVALGDPERSAAVSRDAADDSRRRTLWRAVGRGLWVLSAALLLAAAAHLLGAPPARSVAAGDVSPYPGIDLLSFLVMAVATVGLAVLLLVNGALAVAQRHSAARRSHRFAPYAHGMACTLLTSFGVFLGVGYVGAFSTVVAASLSTGERPVAVPELLSRVVYAWGVTALVLLAVVLAALVSRRRSHRDRRGAVVADFAVTGARGDGAGLRIPTRWVRRVTDAVWTARLKNRVVPLLSGFFVLGVVLTGFVAVELAPQVLHPSSWPLLTGDPRDLPGPLGWVSQSAAHPGAAGPVRLLLLTTGTATLTGLATLLFFLGRTAFLGESARRGVNVVWDVVAFWPRSAHPFVPAAYSQRAVPDLESRIRWHLDRLGTGGTHRRLVLCPHSQGSLLSFAALLRLEVQDPGLLDRIGLVTCGSQLQVMFSRGFPAYVNQAAVLRLFEGLNGAWRNLYRDTDPLAGPVLSWDHRGSPDWVRLPGDPARGAAVGPPAVRRRQEYGPDWRLFDPPVPGDPQLQEDALLALRGHGGYWLDEDAWPAALDAVRRRPPRPA